MLPNVAYDKLPTVIRSFDIAIVPHLDNAHTRGNDLLKILDYCACGVPVVTTNCSNVSRYGNACYIEHDHDSFVNRVAQLMSGRADHDPAPGYAVVQERDWSVQVPRLAATLFPELFQR
jgi:hypothetical protein